MSMLRAHEVDAVSKQSQQEVYLYVLRLENPHAGVHCVALQVDQTEEVQEIAQALGKIAKVDKKIKRIR